MGGTAVRSLGASQGSLGSEMERHPMLLCSVFSLDNKWLSFVLEVEVGDLGKGPCEL